MKLFVYLLNLKNYKIMIYKVVRTYSYRMGTIVEANSEEEAMSIVESNSRDYDWDDEDGGEHMLEDTYCYVGVDRNGDPAETTSDVVYFEA